MNFSPKTTLVQTQTLSQTQLQSLKILSLDNFELNNFLQTEYIENPLLDYNENSNLPSWNQYVSYSSAKEDEDIYKEIPDFSENGIKEFLLDQLNQRNFSDLQWTAMQTMIDCLDDCGYFKLSLKDFSQWFGIDISTVKYCLDILSSLEPLGIFSKDLPHCLLRQLEARQELTPEPNQIIRYHLDDIAAGKINTITQKLSMSTQDVRKCIAKIRELNPRPISGFLTNSTDYIVPDILIDYQDSSWIIRLNDQWIGNYSLCDYYLNMMHTSQSPELKEYFRKKYNRVQLIMHSIEQRRETILKITSAVLERQKDYFTGNSTLKPMTLADIASDISMHTSTISRGIKNKYLQYPFGVVYLKDLFTSSAGKKDNNSPITVKKQLKAIIASENPNKPYSDSTLSNLLKQKGIKISRRTVAKYREEIGIKSTYNRKIYNE